MLKFGRSQYKKKDRKPACRVIPGVNDHDTVLTELNIKPLRNKQTPRKIPLYKKADWEGLKIYISEFGRSLHSNFIFQPL